MSLFWLTVALLLIAVALLLWCASRPSSSAPVDSRDALNKRFYQQRLRELEEDEAQGVVAERQQMVSELQSALLNDIPEVSSAQPLRRVNRAVLLPGVALLIIVSVGLYLKTGGYARVVEWQQVRADYPALRARIMDEQATPPSITDLARLGIGLRASLQGDPNNVQDWLMLGRIGMVVNDLNTASQAFRRALMLAPNDKNVKLSYAEIMTRSTDAGDNRDAELMLRDMLKQDRGNLRILSLLAFNAFQQQHYTQAIGAWELMLRQLPVGDPRRATVESSIAQARSASGDDVRRLTVNVKLTAEAESMLPQGGVLYISVSDGISPVPVAVKRMPISHFPLSLTLDDSDAMMPERRLSTQKTVQVRVRIARDGSANPQSGDWYGESPVMSVNDRQLLTVEVNQRQP